MPNSSKPSSVRVLKQIKLPHRWTLATALFDSRGRIRPDHVRVKGKDETHPEGSYFIEWSDHGRLYKQAVGPDAQQAADRARIKEAQLTAERNGIIPALPQPQSAPQRTSLASALDDYLNYVRYHRSLRTFRTYRPILTSFKMFCPKPHVDDVQRQDLLDFATHCTKQGQAGKSIYNKLVVLSQVLKQHGKRKLLTSADWPSFVETVRPIYEDAELAKLFKTCTPEEEVRFKFYLMSGFRDAEGRFAHGATSISNTSPCASPRNRIGDFIRKIGRNAKFRFHKSSLPCFRDFDLKTLVPTPLCFQAPRGDLTEPCSKSSRPWPTAANSTAVIAS